MLLKEGQNWRSKISIALFLIISIIAVYWQAVGHEFISYDDPDYLTENPVVQQGLTISGILWAFTTFHASNWHPLTWLSHLLDVELFGMNPTGHHLINIVLHSVNSILLFLMLNRYTGFLWRSAVVAMLFALHPLHVESVAWAAERKDVLSALFWLLTLYLYARYAQKPVKLRYLLTLASFFLGLMAKPMLVTLPIVMLLLDYWPLGRLGSASHCNNIICPKYSLKHLIKEKIPFMLLVSASCAVTIFAQRSVIASVANTTIISRIANAVTGYQFYLGKMLLPQNLAVLYPFNHNLPMLQVLSAVALLTSVSIIVVRQREVKPYLLVGWLWYIITLIPVIGIVQVGMQATADRYTYIPLIGIFLLIVWGLAEVTTGWRHQYIGLPILTVTAIIACILTTWHQVSYWKDSTTLFTHTLASTHNNFIAHFLLGCESEKAGNLNEAISSYKAALADNPFYGPAYSKLGKISYDAGKLEEAIEFLYKELFVSPMSVYCRNNLGIALADMGRFDEAISHFTHALTIKPDFIAIQNNLDRALKMKSTSTKKEYR